MHNGFNLRKWIALLNSQLRRNWDRKWNNNELIYKEKLQETEVEKLFHFYMTLEWHLRKQKIKPTCIFGEWKSSWEHEGGRRENIHSLNTWIHPFSGLWISLVFYSNTWSHKYNLLSPYWLYESLTVHLLSILHISNRGGNQYSCYTPASLWTGDHWMRIRTTVKTK